MAQIIRAINLVVDVANVTILGYSQSLRGVVSILFGLALATGYEKYLAKPIDPENLAEVIGTIVGNGDI
jgi:CheY-like chemotaxis protein